MLLMKEWADLNVVLYLLIMLYVRQVILPLRRGLVDFHLP